MQKYHAYRFNNVEDVDQAHEAAAAFEFALVHPEGYCLADHLADASVIRFIVFVFECFQCCFFLVDDFLFGGVFGL